MIAVTELEFSSRAIPEGHAARVDYTIGGKPFTEYFYFDTAAPGYPAIRAAIITRMAAVKIDGDTTYTITCQDGTVGVYQPGGTAAANVSLAISLTGSELTAWGTMRPKLKAYMAKVLFLYRRAGPVQRAWLRAHNAVLDAVLDVIGE